VLKPRLIFAAHVQQVAVGIQQHASAWSRAPQLLERRYGVVARIPDPKIFEYVRMGLLTVDGGEFDASVRKKRGLSPTTTREFQRR